jgi:ABC-type glycerol-3-phosphate transport system substrate-binding protein
VPKKAVAIFFLLAFAGAALFIFFTVPRTKDQIPTSNNQRPFPSAPAPNTPNAPNGVPVPETVPHPNTPKVPPGPSLHVMAWASAADARRLTADADSFVAATGRQVSLTIAADPLSYRRDLAQALTTDTPPDLCLVSSRDFSGLDPAQDLADAKPVDGTPPRAIAAFTVDGRIKAVPDEFTVEMLFYNPSHFDQAGLGYPGPHWTWDMLEADARAVASRQIKDAAGRPTYALELPADFDFWNILCARAVPPWTSTRGTSPTAKRRTRRCAGLISSTRYSRGWPSPRRPAKAPSRPACSSRSNAHRCSLRRRTSPRRFPPIFTTG